MTASKAAPTRRAARAQMGLPGPVLMRPDFCRVLLISLQGAAMQKGIFTQKLIQQERGVRLVSMFYREMFSFQNKHTSFLPVSLCIYCAYTFNHESKKCQYDICSCILYHCHRITNCQISNNKCLKIRSVMSWGGVVGWCSD